MQDNTTNNDTWNSRQTFKNGLSANDMSIFMTSFAATFRESSVVFGQGGGAPLCGMLSEALAGAMKKLLDEATTKEEAHDIMVAACGMAYGVSAAVTNSNPNELANLATSAVSSMVGIAEKDPEAFAASEVRFRVKGSPEDDKIEVMVALARGKEEEGLMGQEAIARKAKEIADKISSN